MQIPKKTHIFKGKWITDSAFADSEPLNVFHRQLDRDSDSFPAPEPPERQDCHIIFRRSFELTEIPSSAVIYITADDVFRLYVNGKHICRGPAPCYRSAYGYMTVDVTPYLRSGRNVIAVHTLYQGLINRVFVSGDGCHGLIFDLVADGKTVAVSDEKTLVARHTGYTPIGTVGYKTQFMERFDSRAAEAGFELPDFDDTGWLCASVRKHVDYELTPQATSPVVREEIAPVSLTSEILPDGDPFGKRIVADFGGMFVGVPEIVARGRRGSKVILRFGQETERTESGDVVRYALRANCVYEEEWILSGNGDRFTQFDDMSIRYLEILTPDRDTEIGTVRFISEHYPFEQKRGISPEYRDDKDLCAIFDLCVRTLKYGTGEVLRDCMEREKGFYLGDGCYSALTRYLLTGDDAIVRKLIDDAFLSSFICDTLVTCLDCSFMQEIAEYPLMMADLMLWHYRIGGDREYLARHFGDLCRLLDAYRRDYEHDGLLSGLDKWCVVEWPAPFRDGYDVDLKEGKICAEPHAALNAYYVRAIRAANAAASELGFPPYRDVNEVTAACRKAFFDEGKQLFRDSDRTEHISYVGNVLAFYAGLFEEKETAPGSPLMRMIDAKGMCGVALFGGFPLLSGLYRWESKNQTASGNGYLRRFLGDEGAWLRMIREGATATFESWGKDLKKNCSLFHVTLSYAAVFLADAEEERKRLFIE